MNPTSFTTPTLRGEGHLVNRRRLGRLSNVWGNVPRIPPIGKHFEVPKPIS